MYNKHRKESFLEFYGKNTNYEKIIRTFEQIEYLEKQYGKDASDFTLSQIIEYLKSCGYGSVNSLAQKVSALRKYTDKCIADSLTIDGINHYREVDIPLLEKCINQYKSNETLFTEGDIWDICERLINVRDQAMIMSVFNGIYGLRGEELSNLEIGDLNRENNIVLLKNELGERKMEVTSDLMKLLVSSALEDRFFSFDKSRVISFLDSRLVFKEKRINNNPISVNTARIAKLKVYLKITKLTFPHLLLSGFINNLKKDIDIKSIEIKKYIQESMYLEIYSRFYPGREITPSAFRQKYKNYLIKKSVQ